MAQEAIELEQAPVVSLRLGIPFAGWLTVERAGYALATVVAAGIRLWGLGAVPLGPAEAAQALPALAAMRGAAPDLLTPNTFAAVSPLLHVLQRVTFVLFGATDGAARFWPAILAGLSPLLFYFLRKKLTPGGALAAAFLWAVSPLGVWSSRLSLGDGMAPTFCLALLALVVWSGRGRAWALLTGLGAGLLLLSGSNAYTAVLAGLLGLAWAGPQARELWADLRREARLAFAGFGIALLVGCFFLADPAVLAAAGNLPGRWLSDLVPGVGEYGPAELLMRLALSELAVLGFGAAGFILALRRRDRFGTWLGASTALALLVALVGRGRHPLDLALVALGLTLLAGPAVATTVANAGVWRREREPWVLVLVSIALLVGASIAIPSGANLSNTPDWRALYTGVGIACLIMAVVIWIAYGVWDSWRIVVMALPVVPLVFGLAWQVDQMVSLSYDRGAWRQTGILHEMPASDLVDLHKLLLDFGGLTGGGRDARVDVAWPNLVDDPAVPVLRWQLRDFQAAEFTAALPAEPARMVITPVGEQPRLDGYSGEEFGVLQRWTPSELSDSSAIIRWVLYREARTLPEKTRAIFWVKW